MARRLLNLMAFVSLALCVATWTARLTTSTLDHETGITFGAPGGRFVVLKAVGAKGHLSVYRDWPTREPLRAFWGERYIGPSGKAGAMNVWTDQRFGLFYEWGDSYVYVAPDGRTPLTGVAAVNSFNPSASPTRFWLLFFPLNLIVAVTAALPAVAGVAALVRYARRASARRARAASRCVRCGYDLRATPARCPECGAVPAAAQRHYVMRQGDSPETSAV